MEWVSLRYDDMYLDLWKAGSLDGDGESNGQAEQGF